MTRLVLSLLAVALLAPRAFAQAFAPGNDVATLYPHPAKDARIIVFRVEGAYAPDAVWLESPKGSYLIRDGELYSLGRDVADYETLRRENIYTLRVEGLNYSATSDVRAPIVRRWTEGATVGVLEHILTLLPSKYTAATECGKRTEDLAGLAARSEAARLSLETAERLQPGYVRDTQELAKLSGTIAQAKAAVVAGKLLCGDAVPASYRGAAQAFDYAQGSLHQVANVLSWLPGPIRQ